MAEPKYTNRLIHEKSPYLQQHAHNPVDWYPWGEEAFKAAKLADKPIFLSIGYATCHWCHVMERESFNNVEVASLLNESFINIKVDREELPEVDHLYMEFAQTMMAGTAGWPLNIILTPELKPFFASTYLPIKTEHGLLGVRELIDRINKIWHSEERQNIEVQSNKIVDIYIETATESGEELPFEEQVEDAAELLFQIADASYGGLKGTPKFPIGYHINFLLAYSAIHQDGRANFLAEKTLDMMHKGGIYDHLGGGFSRYSVDEHWLVPHFEKMLYDNAILSQSYYKAWQLTKKSLYAEVALKTLDYILNRMTHKDGGFYSAEDSEIDGKEGEYYTWTFDEIKSIVSDKDLNIICNFYDITPKGNFNGKNILNTPLSVQEFAEKFQLNPKDVKDIIERNDKKLLTNRAQRKAPFIDDKILTSWNGLMIHSMAVIGTALGEKRYTNAALKAAQFIKGTLWKDGVLFRRWREDSADFRGNLDDYATMIRASLTLFECDFGIEWLAWAMEMTNILTEQFKVADGGAFFKPDGSDPHLLVRRCQFSDGSEPSGNAIHCENLLRLYQMTAHNAYLTQAEDIFKSVKIFLESYPPGYIYHVMNLQRYFNKHAPTIVVALNEQEDLKNEINSLIYKQYIPHCIVVWRREREDELFAKIPFLQEQHPLDGKTTLYICHKGVCREPLNDLDKMTEAIQKL